MLKSVTKLVLLLFSVGLIAFVFLGKIDAKDFMTIASMVFVYYFTRKSSDGPDTFNGENPL